MDNNQKIQLGLVFYYRLSTERFDPDFVPRRFVEDALHRHERTDWGKRTDIVSEHFYGGSTDSIVVVTQPNRLATFVMRGSVYRSDFSKHAIQLGAEDLKHFREMPDLKRYREASELQHEAPAQEQHVARRSLGR
jgi:hypothetical protein